jgi:general secretion pathway protein G
MPGKNSLARSKRALPFSGFTVIEIFLVLIILVMLAAIILPVLAGRGRKAKVTEARSQMLDIEIALDAFQIDTGAFPSVSTGLNGLVNDPGTIPNWKGPYLKKGVPHDPWGNAFIYVCPGRNNLQTYDLMSIGPDGEIGGDDDITNWDEKK